MLSGSGISVNQIRILWEYNPLKTVNYADYSRKSMYIIQDLSQRHSHEDVGWFFEVPPQRHTPGIDMHSTDGEACKASADLYVTVKTEHSSIIGVYRSY
jgi:hypothetical protein